MVPDGHGILDKVPCLVLGQDTSIITKGVQDSSLVVGSRDEYKTWSSSSGTRFSTRVVRGAAAVVVVRGQ